MGSSSSSPTTPSLLSRLRKKLEHVKDFFKSYLSGVRLFGSEVRVATRLAFRVYGQGKRSSRQERLNMKQSFGDLVRVVPLAGLFLVFGLELTTMAILRYMPAMLPRAMRQAVVPAAQKLGVAPEANVDASARRRLTLCTDLVQGARAAAASVSLTKAEALLARVEDGCEDGSKVNATVDIKSAAADFGDDTALALDRLPKAMLLQLAELHLPSGVQVPGPERLGDALGYVSSALTPTLVMRRRLREYVNRLREDDKEILFEGVGALNEEALQRACEDRGLVRGSGTAGQTLLRSRLYTWLTLSKDAAIGNSLLLLAPALLLHDAHSLEEEGGLLLVKLASLRNTALYYESSVRRYTERLEATRQEVAKYQQLLKEQHGTEAAEAAEAALAAAVAEAAEAELATTAAAAEVAEAAEGGEAAEGDEAAEEASSILSSEKRRAALERLESLLDAEEDEDAADNLLRTGAEQQLLHKTKERA